MESGNKNLKKEKNKKVLVIFLSTFFVSLFLAAFAIKALSPNVDVEIADDSADYAETEQTPGIEAKDVDNRLKWIQFEDNMPGVSKRYDSDESELTDSDTEKNDVNVNKNEDLEKVRTATKTTDVKIAAQKKPDIKQQAPVPTRHDVTTVSSPTRVTKVYIGYYSTLEQAVNAQNKVITSGVNVSPFVKEVNGLYVVQAGSYANSQKAQSLYSQLSAMGYPAKLVIE